MFNLRTTLALCATLFTGLAQADVFLPYGTSEFSAPSCPRAGACAVNPQKAGPSAAARPAWRERLSGSAGISYGTKYTSRGMALEDSSTDNTILFSAQGQYALGKKNALVAGISYDWLTDKGLDHAFNEFLCDEFSGIVELAHYFNERTVLAGGYQFVHGGLPGITNYHLWDGGARDFPFFDSNRPEEHSLVLDFHHEFANRLNGFFWDSRVQYSFRWVEGWWFTNTLGYKHQLNDRTDIIASATWHASANYYDINTANCNGTQGYSLNLSAPTMVTKHVRLTPYAGLLFIGNGADTANSRIGDYYRDVTFHLGLSAQYVF